MPQRIDSPLLGDSLSCGPNIISDGHHQRLTASCTIARCASVPLHHRQQRVVALALMERLFLADADHRARIRPVRARGSGIWFMIAAPSTSQPMTPMSAQVSVG